MVSNDNPSSGQVDFKLNPRLSAFIKIPVEPVGKWYEVLIARESHRRGHSSLSLSLGGSSDLLNGKDEEDDDDEDELIIEDDIDFLRSLDPKDWKNQDHYAVLGLKNLRFNSTEAQIRHAYRRKVLSHHPDKRRATGEDVLDDDDYFTCITKAYEILGNPARKMAFDSVDSLFDDAVPSVNQYNKQKFYEVFGPVVERNSRWSEIQPVPQLGSEDSPRDDVEEFYNFWYDFQSWREFSYLDEEEKEKGQYREERRWIEKQNKAVRAKRKKEEMGRIRQLVDNCYTCDPRIQKYREEDKARKLAQKQAKQTAIRLKQEEEEKKRQEFLEAEKQAREKVEAEERQKQEQLKREKEQLKKAVKRERKNLRTVVKDDDYYIKEDSVMRVKNMTDLEKLCELLPLDRLEALNQEFCRAGDLKSRCNVFKAAVSELNMKLEEEKNSLMKEQFQKQDQDSAANDGSKRKVWGHEDLQLLIKSVNLYPSGTSQRWEAIATFLNEHSTVHRTAKEVLAKAKDLQNTSASQLKDVVNERAYEACIKSCKVPHQDDIRASERFDTPAAFQGLNPDPWSSEEQKLLEAALKKFGSQTPDRWDRIAECLPNRSKKDCMKRYKELAEMVRSKKANKPS